MTDRPVAAAVPCALALGLAACAAPSPMRIGEVPESYRVSAALGDVDGDGDLDLLSLHAGEPPGFGGPVTAVWLANLGGGRLGAPQVVVGVDGAPLALPGEPSALALVDWDGDGRRDLLVATPRLCVFRGAAGGFVASPRALEVSSRGFAVADWDGDGELDVVAQDGARLTLWRSARGGLGPPETLQRLVEHDPPLRLDACDVDGDGLPELLVGGQVREEVEALSVAEREVLAVRAATARRVVAAIDALRDELNRSKPPLDDPAAMARRDRRRAALRGRLRVVRL